MSDVSFGKVKILIQDEDILFGGKPRSKNVTKNVHFSLFNQSCVFQWYTHPSFHFSECLFYISLSLFFALVAIFLREGLGVPEGSSLLAKNVSTLLTLINNWKTIRFICFLVQKEYPLDSVTIDCKYIFLFNLQKKVFKLSWLRSLFGNVLKEDWHAMRHIWKVELHYLTKMGKV